MDIEQIIDKAVELSKDGHPQDIMKLIKELKNDDDTDNKQIRVVQGKRKG